MNDDTGIMSYSEPPHFPCRRNERDRFSGADLSASKVGPCNPRIIPDFLMFTGFFVCAGIGEIGRMVESMVDLSFDDTVKCRIVYFSQFVGGRLVLLLAPLLESLIQFRLLYVPAP